VLPAGFLGILLLFILLFFASTWISARTLKREIRQARERRQAPPQIARWWPVVLRFQAWILGVAGALLVIGIVAFAQGNDSIGRGATLLGVGGGCYLLHARVLVAATRRA